MVDIPKEHLDNIKTAVDTFQKKSAEIEEMKKEALENQKALDDLLAWKKSNGGIYASKATTFGEAFAQKVATEFQSRAEEIKDFQHNRNAKLSFELKAVGTMTTANLTGDGVASYGQRQGIVPNQKVNFRDLISTTPSPTGIYVSYKETGGEGSFGVQTEGSAKSQLDYDLTEVKVVSNYVAGITRFSKQLMYQLPFLQNTLVRMLLRDFYKKENDMFYSTVASDATGSFSTSETDDNKQLIDWIMAQQDADFNSSFVLVKNSQIGNLLKLLYGNSGYLGAGSIVGQPNGNVIIAGVPIIGASWATSDKAMIIDTDFIERVETETIRVEFAYQNQDDFEKNMITARCECFEDLNLLRTDAHAYLDFGNES